MSRAARVAAALLPHVNLLLTVIAGAGVASAARLKWDPSTYIALRELAPREYRALAAALPAAALALLLLAHLASLALSLRSARARRVLLLVYAACMAVMVAGELATAWWLAARASAWLHSPQARQLATLAAARDDIRAMLQVLAHWHPLPEKVQQLVDEASEDLPRNGYCAAALAAACIVLQLFGITLATLAALVGRVRSRSHQGDTDTDSQRSLLYSSKSSTLKTVYRDGRLQIV